MHTTLCLAGDVMTGRGIDQILPHPGNPTLHQRNGLRADDYVQRAVALHGPIPVPRTFRGIWGAALEEWERRQPDYRIVNLETSITTSDDHWPDKGIHYRMNPANSPCLAAARFDCCVLANNHVLDWGYAGLQETLETLRDLGMRSTGAGSNAVEAAAPAVLERAAGNRVLVFAWAHPSSYTPDSWAATSDRPGVNMFASYSPSALASITRQIAAFKRPGDVVVVSIHWGENWGYEVGFRQRWFAHRLIDAAGAHVVFGHSPHHPIGVEVYRNQPILYGCGDLLNDYEGIGAHTEYRPDLAAMVFVRLRQPNHQLADLSLVPLRIRGLQLGRPPSSDIRWLCETLNRGGIRVPVRRQLRRWIRLRRTRFNCRWDIRPDQSLGLLAPG